MCFVADQGTDWTRDLTEGASPPRPLFVRAWLGSWHVPRQMWWPWLCWVLSRESQGCPGSSPAWPSLCWGNHLWHSPWESPEGWILAPGCWAGLQDGAPGDGLKVFFSLWFFAVDLDGQLSRCLSVYIAGLLVWEWVSCQCVCAGLNQIIQPFGKAFQLSFSTCLVASLDQVLRGCWCETVLNPSPSASFPPSHTIKENLVTRLKPGCATNQDPSWLTE